MARLEVGAVTQHESARMRSRAAVDDLDQECLVVTDVEVPQDRPFDPGRTLGENRHAGDAPGPREVCELVGRIAGRLPEERRHLLLVGSQKVQPQALGPLGDGEGAVDLRDADQEADRLDAALRGEPDDAAAPVTPTRSPVIPSACGDDVERIVGR